jgi:hypothetical protein
MSKNYPEYYYRIQQLMPNLAKDLPAPMAGFVRLHKAAVAEGALSKS